MPPPSRRKVPFSNKRKKQQLQEKRERKRNEERDEYGNVIHQSQKPDKALQCESNVKLKADNEDVAAATAGASECPIHEMKQKKKQYDPERYRLQFHRESQKDLRQLRENARKPLEYLAEESLEMDLELSYKSDAYLDIPKRPPWDYNMTRDEVERHEGQYFKSYVEQLYAKNLTEKLSYFELNLETWRQLWRVLEMSDVILLIVDIRYPTLHFPPALYAHVVDELNKHLVLVLNKVDMAPPALVAAWKNYFQQTFPQLCVVCFTSYPKKHEESSDIDPGHTVRRQRRSRQLRRAGGVQQLVDVCEVIAGDRVDLSSWHAKVHEDMAAGSEPDQDTETAVHEEEDQLLRYPAFKDGVLTLGCCGYPNVGKSSVINGLMGKKVVSVSRTPGHTKHFQTIFLTPTVKLCDCPGLVFPSLVNRPLQIIAGMYPIAQVREPISVVGYLAQRLDLPRLLKLKHPEADDDRDVAKQWSAYDVCDAWAEKRGFLTAKAARHDVSRAANSILRMACEGRLCLCTRPVGYTADKGKWITDKDTSFIRDMQTNAIPVELVQPSDEELSSTESDSDVSDMTETESTRNMFDVLPADDDDDCNNSRTLAVCN